MSDSNFLKRIEGIQLVKPPSMSHAEYAELFVTLEDAKDRLRPYRGIFEADWLLTDFDAMYWKTKSLDSAQVNDGWVNTMDVDWSIRLPNGESLSDRKHNNTLTTLRKVAFLYRQGFAEPGVRADCRRESDIWPLCSFYLDHLWLDYE